MNCTKRYESTDRLHIGTNSSFDRRWPMVILLFDDIDAGHPHGSIDFASSTTWHQTRTCLARVKENVSLVDLLVLALV